MMTKKNGEVLGDLPAVIIYLLSQIDELRAENLRLKADHKKEMDALFVSHFSKLMEDRKHVRNMEKRLG